MTSDEPRMPYAYLPTDPARRITSATARSNAPPAFQLENVSAPMAAPAARSAGDNKGFFATPTRFRSSRRDRS